MPRPDHRLDLDRVYRDHAHVVLRRARRILGDESEAREVLQEVFLSLLDRPEQYEARSSIITYLYAMTTNACLNRLRNSRRRAALLDRESAAAMRGGEAGPAPPPDTACDAARLLGRMPERLARVAVYYFIDEMTHDEIAELIGVSRRQVGNLVHQAQEEARRSAQAA
jgi:RNA polymerase sigma factor (sigma-70 family)